MSNNSTTEILKNLVLSATVRGGAGKSTLCINLADWLAGLAKPPPFRLFDPDVENKTLLSVFPETTQLINLAEEGAIDAAFNSFATADISVVDGLGSQQRKVFGDWIDETGLLDLAAANGIQITNAIIIDDTTETITQAAEDMGNPKFAGKVRWLVVLNGRDRPVEQFKLWPGSKAQGIVTELEQGGMAKIITFAQVSKNLVDYLRLRKQSPVGIQLSKADALPPLDQSRFLRLVTKYTEQFNSAADILLPTKWLSKNLNQPEHQRLLKEGVACLT